MIEIDKHIEVNTLNIRYMKKQDKDGVVTALRKTSY